MATSLYDLSVASYLQTLGAVAGILERGAAHVREAGGDPDDLVGVKLAEDMLPFAFQIRSVAHHSLGAINGVKSGVFTPPGPAQPLDYAALQTIVTDAQAALVALEPGEINALEGKDVVFQAGERRVPFTAEGFILSFSLPNFYFHASTAYDILRMKGVPLGKRNYMGQLRVKS